VLYRLISCTRSVRRNDSLSVAQGMGGMDMKTWI